MAELDLQARAGPDDGPTLTRWRGLPGGRAVVGAFLVTAAAVGLFVAYLSATAAPTDRFAVAARDIPAGAELEAAMVRLVALDLPEAQAARAVPAARADELAGLTTTGPISRDDLLVRSDVIDTAGPARQVSFPVPGARSLGGRLSRGERIDVLATYPGEGGVAYTVFVARGVRVLDVAAGDDGGLGTAGRVLTVGLDSDAETAALAHAVTQGELVVARAGGDGDGPPAIYRPPGP